MAVISPITYNIPVVRIAVGDFAYNVRSTDSERDKDARPNDSIKYRYSENLVCVLKNCSVLVKVQFFEEFPNEDRTPDVLEYSSEVIVALYDMKRVDVHFMSSSPFISIVLTKQAASRIENQLSIQPSQVKPYGGKAKIVKFPKNGEARITLFPTHVEASTQRIFCEILCKKREVRVLAYQEASKLLGDSRLLDDQKILDIESELTRKFKNPLANRVKNRPARFEKLFGQCVPFVDTSIPSSVLAHELRRVSSFIHYFRDCGGSLEALDSSLEGLEGMGQMEELLRSLYWRYEMIEETMSSGAQICSMCTMPGYLKCKACRIKRYCGEECQQEDVQKGHMKVCGDLKKEETVKRDLVDRIADSVYKSSTGVTYSQFYDRIVKRINNLMRAMMKRALAPGDTYDQLMEKDELFKKMVENGKTYQESLKVE